MIKPRRKTEAQIDTEEKGNKVGKLPILDIDEDKVLVHNFSRNFDDNRKKITIISFLVNDFMKNNSLAATKNYSRELTDSELIGTTINRNGDGLVEFRFNNGHDKFSIFKRYEDFIEHLKKIDLNRIESKLKETKYIKKVNKKLIDRSKTMHYYNTYSSIYGDTSDTSTIRHASSDTTYWSSSTE